VTTYVLEAFVPRSDLGRLSELHRAAVALERPGRPVRLIRSIYLPRDEICFLLLDTSDQRAAEAFGRDLQLNVMRIAKAVTIGGPCRG
jgi:hypothetical protein